MTGESPEVRIHEIAQRFSDALAAANSDGEGPQIPDAFISRFIQELVSSGTAADAEEALSLLQQISVNEEMMERLPLAASILGLLPGVAVSVGVDEVARILMIFSYETQTHLEDVGADDTRVARMLPLMASMASAVYRQVPVWKGRSFADTPIRGLSNLDDDTLPATAVLIPIVVAQGAIALLGELAEEPDRPEDETSIFLNMAAELMLRITAGPDEEDDEDDDSDEDDNDTIFCRVAVSGWVSTDQGRSLLLGVEPTQTEDPDEFDAMWDELEADDAANSLWMSAMARPDDEHPLLVLGIGEQGDTTPFFITGMCVICDDDVIQTLQDAERVIVANYYYINDDALAGDDATLDRVAPDAFTLTFPVDRNDLARTVADATRSAESPGTD